MDVTWKPITLTLNARVANAGERGSMPVKQITLAPGTYEVTGSVTRKVV